MSGWLLVHVLALGAWIGCIATETVVEHAVRRDSERDYVASVHWPIDLYVETPAFVLVALSGVVLFSTAARDGMLFLKVGIGLLAVACNAVCVYVVWRRRAARALGDDAAYRRLDDLQHKLGAALVVLIVVTLALGAYRIS